jgi:hypothetical protein
VTAEQFRLVAAAFGQAVVGAVAFEVALAQVFTAGTVGVAAGIVVVFQVRKRFGVGVALGFERGFQQQTRLLEIVVAAGGAAGAGFQAHGEALDHRLVGGHAVVLQVGGGLAEFAEGALVVAEDQYMALLTVLEVVVDTFFLAQALDKVQVRFVVLHAVIALGVDGRAELELVGVGLDAMLFEHLGDYLWHRQVLEDALVAAVGQVAELRHQGDRVAGQALAGLALADLVDDAVYAQPVWGEGEKCRLVQQALQVEVRPLADQFYLETIRLLMASHLTSDDAK